ncbi:ABC transporter ATP-binding protein [Castellaniella sp.]|uniref:ABC transporter ATP-binding protein n=1 Tax=Castellaniella sp. TaxID=1955812 RepID=UPI00356088A5
MTALAVNAENVRKHYGGVTALKGVDLKVPEGSIYGLIGPNGAGKSTMLDVLCGIVTPSGGCVDVLGMDVTRLSAAQVARRGVGRTFQRTATFGASTVEENLRMASYGAMRHAVWDRILRSPLYRADIASFVQRCEEVLEICGLASVRHEKASSLAYGTQRKLAVAIMLMNEPRIIFLDEPVAGMNNSETGEFVKLVRSIVKGRTVVIVEHDMAAISALCDEVLVMVDGRGVVNDAPERALRHPEVVSAYLGGDDEGVDDAA